MDEYDGMPLIEVIEYRVKTVVAKIIAMVICQNGKSVGIKLLAGVGYLCDRTRDIWER